LLQAYFTNAGNCWQVNFTRIQLLLQAYFTNPGNCWQVNFTRIQLLLQAYFTNPGNCWQVNFTTVHEDQKQQLKQPQTPILFWPSNILTMTVKSSKGLSFEEQITLC
jgi:hypothetical protein